jgi:mRNA interferase MazF
VSTDAVASNQKYPLLAVVPVTATPGEGALYPPLAPGPSGLRQLSWALIDQIRAVDKRRVRRVFGRLAEEDLRKIDEGLRLFLGLHEP